MSHDNVDIYKFLHECAAGNMTARRQFHEQYGEDIYHFPIKIYGAPFEEAGDYYLYVFDQDRIFSRLKTFAGLRNIQFRTFLSYYVLKHLFLEWRRTRKAIDTISLQTPLEDSSDDARTLEDLLPDVTTRASVGNDQALTEEAHHLLSALAPEDRLLLKLLSLAEYNLSSEDVCFLATISQRTVHDTLAVLAEIHSTLKRKDAKIARLYDELDSVWGWIVLRQKELQTINQQLLVPSTLANGVETKGLFAQKQALEHALAKRVRQHEQLIEELRTYKLTTSYKDIAQLLNSTTSAVYSRLFRLREHLTRERDEQSSRQEYVL